MAEILFNADLRLGPTLLATGSGTPEGSRTAPVGSLFLRTDGGTGTTLYRKESGSGNTGWVAVSAGGAGLSDGNYGDVTVSGGGTIIRINDDVEYGYAVAAKTGLGLF